MHLDAERKQIALALKRAKGQEDRITDAYRDEAMDLPRYKAEMAGLRGRRTQLEQSSRDLESRVGNEQAMHAGLERLDQFCEQVTVGLENLTFEERQQLLRLVVERVVVENGVVRIETVIPIASDKLRSTHPEVHEG